MNTPSTYDPGDFLHPDLIAEEDRRAVAWLADRAARGEDMARWVPGRRAQAKREEAGR